jgi:F0F1-type ATP synthase assembly protein I
MTDADEHDRDLWRLALRFITLGTDLAVPIFGGVLLGYVLDRKLGTGYALTVGLLILGIGVGYYNVVQAIRRFQSYDRPVSPEPSESRAERERREPE